MTAIAIYPERGQPLEPDLTLFAAIASDLERQGYSVQPNALPACMSGALLDCVQTLDPTVFKEAGIGRGGDYLQNDFVRKDAICWITGETPAGRQWLDWTLELQRFLNRRLFLGLFSFESHFAHYRPGAFYKRHYDAFKGQANRTLSVVAYLNPDWIPSDGGSLVLYRGDGDRQGLRVQPLLGTLVVFLSEEFPHEVLAAQRDRYSIAGWYRVNTSLGARVDPPR